MILNSQYRKRLNIGLFDFASSVIADVGGYSVAHRQYGYNVVSDSVSGSGRRVAFIMIGPMTMTIKACTAKGSG